MRSKSIALLSLDPFVLNLDSSVSRKFELILFNCLYFFSVQISKAEKYPCLNSKAINFILQRTLVQFYICYLGYFRNAEQAGLGCALWSEFLRLREL